MTVPLFKWYKFLKKFFTSSKNRGHLSSAGHTRGLIPSLGVPRRYVMYLWTGKGTSGCPSLFTAVVPNTDVKTAFVPLCEAHRRFTEPPQRNTWLFHFWLVDFYILIVSLAEDIQFCGLWNPKFSFLSTYLYFFRKNLKIRTAWEEAKHNLKSLRDYWINYTLRLFAYLAHISGYSIPFRFVVPNLITMLLFWTFTLSSL